MLLHRNRLTHVRFEPDVDRGTTYAFEYKTGKVIVGREKMHRVILSISAADRDLDWLEKEFVDQDASTDEAYGDRTQLLVDLLKLVDANVLGVAGKEAGDGAPKDER